MNPPDCYASSADREDEPADGLRCDGCGVTDLSVTPAPEWGDEELCPDCKAERAEFQAEVHNAA